MALIMEDRKKKSLKSKMTNFCTKFLTPFSSSTSNLQTDAVAVNLESSTTPMSYSSINSVDRLNSNDPWQNLSNGNETIINGEEQQIENQIIALPPSELLPPQVLTANRFPNTLNSLNNSMTVNNVENQINYNFSDINGLHIGPVYNVAANEKSQKTSTEAVKRTISANDGTNPEESTARIFKKTRSIVELMNSNELLEFIPMKILSEHMGLEWRFIIRLLGFSDGQIQQMYEEKIKDGIKEVIYSFLLDWKRNDENPTIGKLCTLLWRNKQQECVFILKEHFKHKKTVASSDKDATIKEDISGDSEQNLSDEEQIAAKQKL